MPVLRSEGANGTASITQIRVTHTMDSQCGYLFMVEPTDIQYGMQY